MEHGGGERVCIEGEDVGSVCIVQTSLGEQREGEEKRKKKKKKKKEEER